MREESKKSINQIKELIDKDAIDNQDLEKAKYLRQRQGTQLYNMSRTTFCKLALESGGLIKIGSMVIVERETFERYLESFRVPSGVGGMYGV